MPSKVRLISEVWRYYCLTYFSEYDFGGICFAVNLHLLRVNQDLFCLLFILDSSYMDEESDKTMLVSAWIPLLDATPDNGCMQVRYGASHYSAINFVVTHVLLGCCFLLKLQYYSNEKLSNYLFSLCDYFIWGESMIIINLCCLVKSMY